MPAGIDIGDESIFVALPDRTVRQRNAVCRLEAATDADTSPGLIQVGEDRYAVGDAVEEYSGTGEILTVLEAASELPREVRARAVETLLSVPTGESEGAGEESEGADDTGLGYVDRGRPGDETASLFAETFDVRPVDPAVAVCYDAFETAPTGIGICIDGGRAFATLVAGGIPVATATHRYRDRWYDVTDGRELDGDGPRADWLEVRYGTLLAELALELAPRAPAFGEPLRVAFGGDHAPDRAAERLAVAFGEELGVDVGSVTVAETPAEAPVRGALVAAQSEDWDGESAPIPGFAADVGYAPGRADVEVAAEVFEDAVERPRASAGTARTAGTAASRATERTTGGQNADRDGSTGAVATRSRFDAHSARLADAHDRLVATVDAGDGGQFDELRDEIQSAIAAVEDELEQLDDGAARAEALADLREEVADLEGELADVDEDVREARAVLAGLDDDHAIDVEDVPGRAFDSMALGTLQHDIDAVEEELSNRIEQLWSELDDVNDELVDVTATLRDLPALESRLESTSDSVATLNDETATLRQSLADLREEVDEVEDGMAGTGEVEAVEATLDRVTGELDELRSQLAEVEQAEPEVLDDVERELDVLRDTVGSQEERLSGVERTTSDLDTRISRAFQDTAKAEALASVQTEVSRIESDVSSAQQSATGAARTAETLETRVETIREELDRMQTMSDSLAESSVTRSELEESVAEMNDRLEQFETTLEASVDERLDELSKQGAATPLMLRVMAATLGAAGALGAVLAFAVDQTVLGVVFALLVIGPAAWLSYSVETSVSDHLPDA